MKYLSTLFLLPVCTTSQSVPCALINTHRSWIYVPCVQISFLGFALKCTAFCTARARHVRHSYTGPIAIIRWRMMPKHIYFLRYQPLSSGLGLKKVWEGSFAGWAQTSSACCRGRVWRSLCMRTWLGCWGRLPHGGLLRWLPIHEFGAARGQ